MLDTGLTQHVGQFGSGADVVGEIFLGYGDAFADSLVGCKVNGPVHGAVKHNLHGVFVSTIDSVKLYAFAQDAFNALEDANLAVAQVVYDDRSIARFGQCYCGMGADKASSSCDQNALWGVVVGHVANIGNPARLYPVPMVSDSVRQGSIMQANHYNLDYLKQVFQGNDAMVLRILDIFEEEVPKYFAEMSRLASAGQWGGLHPLAHKSKSSIGMLGMHGLLKEVLVVENLSRTAGDEQRLQAALLEATQLLEVALDALRADRTGGLLHSPKLGSEAPTKASEYRETKRLYRA